jgi:DNA-binding LacI/PurR family transcriptional regulator
MRELADQAAPGLAPTTGGALTIKQVAALAGVSRSTVSRVLNSHPNVRADVRATVLRVIDEHNYTPATAARSLASQRSRAIAFLIPRSTSAVFASPYFPLLIQSMSEACGSRGYVMMLCLATGAMEQDFLRLVRGRLYDGVIVQGGDVDDPVLPSLIKTGVPFVHYGRHPYLQHMSWVDSDNADAGRQAASHFLALGHQRIATITGPLQEACAVDRRDGYKQALLEAGIPVAQELIVEADWLETGGYAAMQRLLALPRRPTAVFAANDQMAFGAMRAIREAGLAAPEDVALAGFDNLPTPHGLVPLTTLTASVPDMCMAAVNMLIDRLEGGDSAPRHLWFPCTLLVRQSSGASEPLHNSMPPVLGQPREAASVPAFANTRRDDRQ